ncbi:MAG: DUF1501 family [Verrucomicrobia bacterium]|nr:MAG: DUF1501 family [Verrucomicrobiota bacterium]
MKLPPFASTELSRRKFAALTARTLLGVGLLPKLCSNVAFGASLTPKPSAGGSAKNVIYLYMDGGMSHIDSWDPKQGETAGPTKTIKTSADGVLLAEYLPKTAQQMHHGTVIRSLTSTQGAHEQGNYYMHTSYELRGTISHPAMGSWLSHFQGPGNPMLPGSVYIGNASRHPGAGFFPPAQSPLFVNNPENGLKNIEPQKGVQPELHQARMALASLLDQDFTARFPQRNVAAYTEAYDGASKMMRSSELVAFDLTREKQALRDAYGKSPFGQGCLLARRLVEAGIRFVEVSLHGWDTHTANFVGTPDLCDQLDRGLATLLDDLHLRGLLKDTLVVVATEFGRSPKINVNVGRDHYPKAFSAALFGGGIQNGAAFGATDKTGAEIISDKVLIPDLNATIGYALGLPLQEVVLSPSGRPFTVAHKGTPLTQLFA